MNVLLAIFVTRLSEYFSWVMLLIVTALQVHMASIQGLWIAIIWSGN